MATSSILTKLKLNKKDTERYLAIMEAESPCKDIQPISAVELQKSKDELKEWLAKSSH